MLKSVAKIGVVMLVTTLLGVGQACVATNFTVSSNPELCQSVATALRAAVTVGGTTSMAGNDNGC